VDSFDQKVNAPFVAETIDKLLLDCVKTVVGEVFGWLWRLRQQTVAWCPCVKPLQSRGVDGLADRLATRAAEATNGSSHQCPMRIV